MKALVVDDSKTIRMMLKKFLQGEGFTTLYEAGDGREALTKLDEVGPVDLALVDWNMPVMDGLEFVTALRQGKKYEKVRVMMVTTETEDALISRAMDAGANAYIKKPFNPDGLREKLGLMGFPKSSA